VSLGLVMALSGSRLSQGKRGKPGPRSPTCRELTYPAPRASLASPASDGKRLPASSAISGGPSRAGESCSRQVQLQSPNLLGLVWRKP
jgi:hypothetical protein